MGSLGFEGPAIGRVSVSGAASRLVLVGEGVPSYRTRFRGGELEECWDEYCQMGEDK